MKNLQEIQPPAPHAGAPMPPRENAMPRKPRLARRVFLLLMCLAVGGAIGFVGQNLTSRSEWFLAIPACLIVAWLFVADPTECAAPDIPRRGNGPVNGNAAHQCGDQSEVVTGDNRHEA
jgi:hypothetical protein